LRRLDVIAASFVGSKESSSSLGKSYGSKDDRPDPEAVAEVKRLFLGMLSGLMIGNGPCLAQYSFSTYG